MRILFLGLLLCCLVIPTAFAGAQDATLILKKDQFYAQTKDQSTLLPYKPNLVNEGEKNLKPGQPVVRFITMSEDDEKKYGVKEGLYLFNDQGKALSFTPLEYADYIFSIKLSADKQPVLAVDSGTSHIRDWNFFSFPEMKPLGQVTYFTNPDQPHLIWVADQGVLFPNKEEKNEARNTCQYESCEPVSVNYFTFADKKVKTILQGTDLCDYVLTGYQAQSGKVEAEKLCLKSVKDWDNYPENLPTTKVTAKLPSM